MYVNGRPQFNLTKSRGVPKNDDEGVQWLIKAANVNYREAQRDLGKCYLNGTGVAKDVIEAHAWLKLACRGDRIRQGLYLDGLVLKMNPDQISQGEKRVQAFEIGKRSLPDPLEGKFQLGGIMKTSNSKIAVINGKLMRKGESANITIGKEVIVVRCLEIGDGTLLIETGSGKQRELKLQK